MSHQKLIVLSADAMVTDDLALLETMPNFRRFFAHCAKAESLRSIYPTVTYPVHTTLLTGVYPDKHGICENDRLTPGATGRPWHWFAEDVKIKGDLFTAAKAAGLTTAGSFWPVTGNHPAVDWLLDEYPKQGESDTFEAAYTRTGSSREVLEKVVFPHLKYMAPHGESIHHPYCDQFVVSCAAEMIRQFQPDLLMIHPADIDAARHSYGLFNDHVNDSVMQTDFYLGQLIQACIETGVWEDTNLVLLSDHGQMEIVRILSPNVKLADEGLITADENGRLKDWEAFSYSAGMSAQVWLKRPDDKELWDRVYKVLCGMRDEGIYGIGQVFTREEIAEREHLDGGFSFILETDGCTAFSEQLVRPMVSNYDVTDYRYGRATHGYLPDRGPQPVFMGVGPGFRPDARVGRRPIVDVTPTLADLLGVKLPHQDGVSMKELLK